MRITKGHRLLVDRTDRVYGLLEQGGVCGQVVSYDLAAAERVTGMTRAELAAADETDYAAGCEMRIRQLLAHELEGRVVRRGDLIR